MKLKQGSTLQNGRFTIIKVLGQGGFGITYLAKNEMLDKLVAIKEFFPSDFCDRDNCGDMTVGTKNNRDFIDKLKHRFIKEARNIAKLDHPGIVKIYDIFEENQTAYYVMELIEGETLQDIIRHNGSMPEDSAIQYICNVADALKYIHAHNMTHFDIKPSNIIVRRQDLLPILIDFGLSKQYDRHGLATSTMIPAFSRGFSPMELYHMEGLTEFSPQSDVYSLGATLYYLLIGKIPPIPTEIIEVGLTYPEDLKKETIEFITKTMQIARINRPSSIEEALKLLKNESCGEKNDVLIDEFKINHEEDYSSVLNEKLKKLQDENKELLKKLEKNESQLSKLKIELKDSESQRRVHLENIGKLIKEKNDLLKNLKNTVTECNDLKTDIKKIKERNKSLYQGKVLFSFLFILAALFLCIIILS